MRKNLKNSEHIEIINNVLHKRYLELLYVYLRDKKFPDYLSLCKTFRDDEEISFLSLYPQHIVDTIQRIGNKIIKRFSR